MPPPHPAAQALFDPGRRRRECGGELRAQAVHDRDDGNGNPCGNKAILDRRGARFVFEKLHEGRHLQRLQVRACCLRFGPGIVVAQAAWGAPDRIEAPLRGG